MPSGALISAVISPIMTARSVRASDRRKAAQEGAMQTRKETREDKLRDEKSLYSAAQEFRSGGHRIPDRNHRCQRGLQHPA